jgi:hypothetical protein
MKKSAKENGVVIVNLVGLPIFVIGFFLCLWAIYLSFSNSYLENQINILKKKKTSLDKVKSQLDDDLTFLDERSGIKSISDEDKKLLEKCNEECLKKILYEGKDAEKAGPEKTIYESGEYKEISQHYAQVKFLLQEKIKYFQDIQLKLLKEDKSADIEKDIQQFFEKKNKGFNKDLIEQINISYPDLLSKLHFLSEYYHNVVEHYRKRQEMLKRYLEYYQAIDKLYNEFEENSKKTFAELNSKALEDLCNRIKDVQRKNSEITFFVTTGQERKKAVEKDLQTTKDNLARTIENLRKNLEALRVIGVLKKDIFQYSGSLVRDNFASKSVVVSFGSQDGLKAGNRFYVYDYFPIGGYRWKGIVEIVKTEKNHSIGKIVYEAFKTAPIRTGDLLASPFFKRANKTRVFLFGKFEKVTFGFNLQELKEHLTAIGVIVQDNFDLYTDFVIKGTEYPEREKSKYDKEWKKIRELGIPTIELNDLLPLLGGYIKVIK